MEVANYSNKSTLPSLVLVLCNHCPIPTFMVTDPCNKQLEVERTISISITLHPQSLRSWFNYWPWIIPFALIFVSFPFSHKAKIPLKDSWFPIFPLLFFYYKLFCTHLWAQNHGVLLLQQLMCFSKIDFFFLVSVEGLSPNFSKIDWFWSGLNWFQ